MCDPITIGIMSFAISAASQLVAYNQQKDAIERQNAENIRRYNEAATSNAKSLALEQKQESLRVIQEQNKAVDDALQLRRETLQAKGTLAASSNAVSGLTDQLLSQDINRQSLDYQDVIKMNIANVRQQSGVNQQGFVADAQSSTNQYYPQIQEGPDPMGVMLGVAGSGMQAYVGYKNAVGTNYGPIGNKTYNNFVKSTKGDSLWNEISKQGGGR